jgi:hypothetical protein
VLQRVIAPRTARANARALGLAGAQLAAHTAAPRSEIPHTHPHAMTSALVAQRSPRTTWFLVMLLVAFAGQIAAPLAKMPWQAGLLLCLIPYMGWIESDERQLGLRGWKAFAFFLLSMVLGWGLLLYMVLTRGSRGLGLYIAASLAVWVAALLGAFIGHTSACLAYGRPW